MECNLRREKKSAKVSGVLFALNIKYLGNNGG